jgi:hypothetical protein
MSPVILFFFGRVILETGQMPAPSGEYLRFADDFVVPCREILRTKAHTYYMDWNHGII